MTMTPDQYIECLTQGKAPSNPVAGLHGRIIRGTQPSHFDTLSNDETRLIVYLTDSEGLADLLTHATTKDMLLAIGYDDGHINRLRNENTQFKVVVFPESSSYAADWAGLLEVVARVYPETAPYCQKYLQKFIETPYTHWEVMAGFDFGDHDKKDDPRFMSYDVRPECSSGETWLKSNRDSLALRRLLYHAVHVREKYLGTGFTKGADGSENIREYLLDNRRIADIAGAAVADLPPL